MANKETAELTAAATLDGTELVHVVQSGNSRRSTVGALAIINPLTGKVTPVDADELRIADSAASFDAKKLTFANLWAWAQAKILTLFNASGTAPVYACRAWVNFNGTGTVAVRASGNVSSITDSGVGDYTVNFTTAFATNNYAVSGTCEAQSGSSPCGLGVRQSGQASGSVRVSTWTGSSASVFDPVSVFVVVHI